MGVHTLPEYAKTLDDVKAQAIVELFPEMVDFFEVFPFETAPGGVMRYYEEGALPDNVGFRGINEEPTNGYGLLSDKVEICFPMAGNLDVDRVMVGRNPSRRTIDEKMQLKAKGKVWADTIFHGNNSTNPKEFTGMEARLHAVNGSVDGSNYKSRLMANSTASGGGPLSLIQLDIAIGLVERPERDHHAEGDQGSLPRRTA